MKKMEISEFRKIPKMDHLLENPAISALLDIYPRELVKDGINEVINSLREEIKAGKSIPDETIILEEISGAIVNKGRFSLRRVVNATGVVLHTNLGRAPLSYNDAMHVAEIASCYNTLEYNLDKAARGSRYVHVEELLCRITGAEAALTVNNNASAVFLMLNTLTFGRSVAVSRGELVEIGGSFRIPEIMGQSGASLIEIGTTNKTHPSDYIKALDVDGAQAVLKVHTSNFKICGFSESVSPAELRKIADEHNVPLLYDLGAGFLLPPGTIPGISDNGVYVSDAVKYADVVCFSGDKLFGSGQAGIILGKKEYIERMKKNQILRMLRLDKMTLSALESTLRHYLDPNDAVKNIPTLRMLSMSKDKLKFKAEKLAEELNNAETAFSFEPIPCTDEPGGGTLPTMEIDGYAVKADGPLSPDALAEALRKAKVPIIGRITDGSFLMSVRTLLDLDDVDIISAFRAIGT